MKTNVIKNENSSKNFHEELDEEIATFILFAMIQNNITRHPNVVIKYPLGDHLGIINKAQGIHDLMSTSTWMSGISGIAAKLAAFQAGITTYVSLEANAKLVPGGVAARDTFSSTFVSETSEDLRVIVQGVVNLNKTSALTIAQSCNMEIQGIGGKQALEWNVKKGELSKSAELSAKIKGYNTKRYAVQFQKTTDMNDEDSWYLRANEIVPLLQAETTVFNLTLKDTVYFRFRLILADGPTEWSEVISIIIT